MASPHQPIGLFDSGVGGLSVAAALRRLLPAEALVYYADRAHFPYGSRSAGDVQVLACRAAEQLLDHGAKLIVVACNTASSVALATLRARYPVPFVGVVPGVKPATHATANGRVAVLATEATFQTAVFGDLVQQFAAGVDVTCQVCPDLVALVERGVTSGPEVEMRLRAYVAPLVAAGADTLVLGCTHYAFLRDAVQQAAGPAVRVIDTADAVALQVQRVLGREGLLAPPGPPGAVTLLSSGPLPEFLAVAARLWPEGVCAAA